ncbi:MAG TPA: ABC transporter permease subunit [Anaerolineales bacterium]|nr:ABC transporter permease subunit [Anaerolineales bacterium]
MIARTVKWLNPVRWWEAVRANPVVLKEMRSRMRGWRALVSLAGFLVLIGGTIGMIYLGFAQSGTAAQGVTIRKTIGQTIFYTIFMLQLFIVGISAPGLTASAIAGEREHQTYDLLRTTLLSARSLVIGKLVASISFVLLLLIASLPIQSIGFIFGGIAIGEIAIGVLILVLTAVTFGAAGLFFSSVIRRARIAAVLTQVTTLTFSVGFPLIVLIGIMFISGFGLGTSNSAAEWLILGIGWLVVITSPVATAIVTEIVLVNEQSYFFFNIPINGVNVWVPSPWLGFTLLYSALAILFLALSVQMVRRPERV